MEDSCDNGADCVGIDVQFYKCNCVDLYYGLTCQYLPYNSTALKLQNFESLRILLEWLLPLNETKQLEFKIAFQHAIIQVTNSTFKWIYFGPKYNLENSTFLIQFDLTPSSGAIIQLATNLQVILLNSSSDFYDSIPYGSFLGYSNTQCKIATARLEVCTTAEANSICSNCIIRTLIFEPTSSGANLTILWIILAVAGTLIIIIVIGMVVIEKHRHRVQQSGVEMVSSR
jgi:hypothetical protein